LRGGQCGHLRSGEAANLGGGDGRQISGFHFHQLLVGLSISCTRCQRRR
jgi:hypothetical protein